MVVHVSEPQTPMGRTVLHYPEQLAPHSSASGVAYHEDGQLEFSRRVETNLGFYQPLRPSQC